MAKIENVTGGNGLIAVQNPITRFASHENRGAEVAVLPQRTGTGTTPRGVVGVRRSGAC
jgi:hypothetical protein